MKPGIFLIVATMSVLVSVSFGYTCDRTPKTPSKNKHKLNKYLIEISGNPKGYVPGESYTISLKSNPAGSRSFIKFTIVAEPENHLSQEPSSVGKLIPIDDTMVTYTYRCPNAVVQTQILPKTSVDVLWRAPKTEGGCISIKATVIESSDSWFSDDGGLTRTLCAEDERNEDVQPPTFESCTACNEAKYEIAFQGMWSRNTHPKDFPSDMWSTKLGDIVGASHKFGKSFWNYGAMATEGLRSLAEEGNTQPLETELMEMLKNDDIRTIVKARELTPPNITATSYTLFRVDHENHLLSLVSKIIPSPDWIVGVANLELCSNGSWVESRVLNLYPWDVGTDDGLTYDSPDLPSQPQQAIRRIKSNSPNTEKSPFYNEDGDPIKPVAKLHVKRLKLYEKFCESSQSEEATATDDDPCALSDWSVWSSCSVTCGQGVKTRDRSLINPHNEDTCLKNDAPALQETETCEGEAEDCEDQQEEDCSDVEWTNWTPCSTTCGTGTKERTILSGEDADEENTETEKSCREVVECYNPDCEVVEQTTLPVFNGPVDSESQVILRSPDGPVQNCKVSKWSHWQPCTATEPCSRGYQYKERHILVHNANGGKKCPSLLRKRKRCRVPCTKRSSTASVKVDCVMGPWNNWSPCSNNCGVAVQLKTRDVLREAKNGGKPCGPRTLKRKCPLPLACR